MKLLDDIKEHKRESIAVGIGLLTLIVAILAYRRSQNSTLPIGGVSGVAPTGSSVPPADNSSTSSTTSGTTTTTSGFYADPYANLPQDYSAIGPYANQIAEYGYEDILHQAPNSAGLSYWESLAEQAQTNGAQNPLAWVLQQFAAYQANPRQQQGLTGSQAAAFSGRTNANVRPRTAATVAAHSA